MNLKRSALIDAGPMIALFDAGDRWHEEVSRFLQGWDEYLVTSMAVATEAAHLLRSSTQSQINLLKWLGSGGARIVHVDGPRMLRAAELMRKYSDLPMDFADATLVVLGEERGIERIVTMDSDFKQYRMRHGKRFVNVLAQFLLEN